MEKVNDKVVNAVLIVLIVGSAAFIGHRLFMGRKSAPPVAAGPVFPGASVAPVVRPRQFRFGISGVAAFAQQPKIQTATWSAILAKEKLVPIDETTGCKVIGNSLESYYPNLSADLNNRLVELNGGILPRYGVKKCHKKGQTIHVSYFGDGAAELYVDAVGDFKIVDIVELDREKVSEEFWKSLGVNSMNINSPFAKMALLRVEKQAEAKLETLPSVHFRYPQLTEASFGMLQGKKVVVVDLRDSASRAALTLPNAIALDFPVASGPLKSEKFRWDVKIGDLERSPAKMEPVAQTAKDQTIVVVGNSADDGRPFWILREFSNLNFENVLWYMGSADKLKTALQP